MSNPNGDGRESEEQSQSQPHKSYRRWGVRAAIIVLTATLAVFALVGPEEVIVRDYTGELDLPLGSKTLVGEGISGNLRIAKEQQPPADVNLTFDPENDGTWILIGVGNPTLSLEIVNGTESISIEAEGISSVGITNLRYLTGETCFYWINASAAGSEFRIRLQEVSGYAFPVITVDALNGEVGGAISVVTRLQPSDSSSVIRFSATDPILRHENTLLEPLGTTTVTITNYEWVYLLFSTTSHDFTLPTATRISWKDGPLTLHGVSGVLRSSGVVREFHNATLETTDVPRRVTMETGPIPSDFPSELSITLELEGTLIQVTDSSGSGVVGQVHQDTFPVPGWLDRRLEGIIAVILIAVLAALSLLETKRR